MVVAGKGRTDGRSCDGPEDDVVLESLQDKTPVSCLGRHWEQQGPCDFLTDVRAT